MTILAYYSRNLELTFCLNCVLHDTNLLGQKITEIYYDDSFELVRPIFDYLDDDDDESVFTNYELANFEHTLECAECETKIATN